MATLRITDPVTSINPQLFRIPAGRKMERLDHRDQLNESLQKAEAMMAIFSYCEFHEFNEATLRNFVSATLDMLCLATDALKVLDEMEDNKAPLTRS